MIGDEVLVFSNEVCVLYRLLPVPKGRLDDELPYPEESLEKLLERPVPVDERIVIVVRIEEMVVRESSSPAWMQLKSDKKRMRRLSSGWHRCARPLEGDMIVGSDQDSSRDRSTPHPPDKR